MDASRLLCSSPISGCNIPTTNVASHEVSVVSYTEDAAARTVPMTSHIAAVTECVEAETRHA